MFPWAALHKLNHHFTTTEKKKEENYLENWLFLLHKTRQHDAQILYDHHFVLDDFKFAGGFGDIIISTTTTTTFFLYYEKNDDEETNVWEEFDDFRRRRFSEEFLLQ